mgnify:CR=1 FL=1
MLIGNLGKDPDVQFLEGNIGVAKFPLATTETFKDRSGKLVSQTEWHTVVLMARFSRIGSEVSTQRKPLYILKGVCVPGVGKIKKVIENFGNRSSR